MNIRRIAVLTAAGAIVAGGAGVAVGATTGEKAEQQVLADAAKRLDTTPQKLRDALAAAQNAELDRAVEAGEITQEQADRIKADRKRSGRVLGGRGPGGPRGHHGPGMRGPRGGPIMDDVANALGISREALREQLHHGKSIADVARAEGMRLDAVKAAARSAAKARLDKAVDAGELTREQADARLAHLEEHLARFDQPRPAGPPPRHP